MLKLLEVTLLVVLLKSGKKWLVIKLALGLASIYVEMPSFAW